MSRPRVERLLTLLAEWFLRTAPPASGVVDAELLRLPAAVRADAEFLAGWYLADRGEHARAALEAAQKAGKGPD